MSTPNQIRSSKNKKAGNQVEDIALMRLHYLGVEMAFPIHDKWIPMKRQGPHWICKKGKLTCDKLPADIWGCLPGGQLVLCECKYRSPRAGKEPRLQFSDLEIHQVANLNKARSMGAVPLLFWHSGGRVYVLPWPIAEFVPKSSLTPTQAETVAINDTRALRSYAKHCHDAHVQALLNGPTD